LNHCAGVNGFVVVPAMPTRHHLRCFRLQLKQILGLLTNQVRRRSVLQIAHYITVIPGEHGALGKGPIAITRNAQVLYQLHVVLRPRLQLRNSTKVLRSSRYEQLATKVLYHSDLLITIYYLRQKGCLLCL